MLDRPGSHVATLHDHDTVSAHSAAARVIGPVSGFARCSPWTSDVDELANLGVVLCVWRQSHGSELECLRSAAVTKACMGVTSMGLQEWLALITRNNQCCMRVYPLPRGTDSQAWSHLLQRLPAECSLATFPGACSRLAARFGDWVRGEQWKFTPLSFLPRSDRHAQPAATVHALQGEDEVVARRICAQCCVS